MSSADSAPLPDEFELSLFGPGVGECVLLHLGQGIWMVVDSCINASTKNPIALDYLAQIGVDPAAAVNCIVVTHWHDDHIRGIAQVYEVAAKARVVCSAARNTAEFQKVLGAAGTFSDSSGADHMYALFRKLESRSVTTRYGGGLTWALANMCIYRSPRSTVHPLSPSSSTFNRAMHEFSQLIPPSIYQIGREKEQKKRAVSNRPNELSIALWIECGPVRALLGADLERGRDSKSGWRAIVNSTVRPPGKARIFKVPHHGSSNADQPQIWSELLDPQPLAVITPFRRKGLPKDDDLARLSGYTPKLYCTTHSRGKKARGRPGSVNRIVRRVAPDLRFTTGPMGHVRIRVSSGGDPTIETFGPAHKVDVVA